MILVQAVFQQEEPLQPRPLAPIVLISLAFLLALHYPLLAHK
jgi:hypothetical protein